jgi:hypothetical protein
MKVIYTFKKFKNIPNIENPIFLDMARLSVQYSKMFYKTELYCDEKSKKFFDKNNIKFDNVFVLDEIENYDGEMYTIPKMITYSKQTEPYIHLDFDTIVLKHLTFNKSVTFGYHDEDYSQYINIKYSPFVYNTYINTFENHIKNYYDPNEYLQWRWMKFTNNSLFAVNDYIFVSNTYSEILERLKDVTLLPDPEINIGQFLEQFLIVSYLDSHKKNYDCLYKKNPLEVLKESNPYKLDNVFNIPNKLKFIHLQNFKNLDAYSYKLLYYFYDEKLKNMNKKNGEVMEIKNPLVRFKNLI